MEQRNGKVYVSMEAQLLFPSGSAVVDDGGQAALQVLAGVIAEQSGRSAELLRQTRCFSEPQQERAPLPGSDNRAPPPPTRQGWVGSVVHTL